MVYYGGGRVRIEVISGRGSLMAMLAVMVVMVGLATGGRSGTATGVDCVVVGALTDQDQIGNAEVAGESYRGGREAREEGACGSVSLMLARERAWK